MKKIISTVIGIILLISLSSAMGVTYPHPQNIELTPGQSSYFTFKIYADDFPIVCKPSIQESNGLELAFNEEYKIEANEKFSVKPQVIAPKQTPFGSLEATFCMECSPAVNVSGSRIIPRICNLPVSVNIVSERTRKNMMEGPNYFWIWITFLIIAIVILAIAILYLVRKKRR